MMARLVLLLMLVTAACAPNNATEPCGKPGKMWVQSSDFVYPDLATIHKIEITHMNQILVNEIPRDEKAVNEFLASLADRPFDVLLFDFDAHADCNQVRTIRTMIESKKFCEQENCVYGDPAIKPPEFNPQKTLQN
jgi:hypothetical protein